jgi:hypothetical protein
MDGDYRKKVRTTRTSSICCSFSLVSKHSRVRIESFKPQNLSTGFYREEEEDVTIMSVSALLIRPNTVCLFHLRLR